MRILFAGILFACSTVSSSTAGQFDPKPWLDDLAQARSAFAQKYANFEWAVFQRQAALSKLFDDAHERIAAARGIADAKSSLERLARDVGDGHVDFIWAPEPPDSSQGAAFMDVCVRLGYDERLTRPSLTSHLRGYKTIASASEFPAGLVMLNDHKVGVIRIGLFGPNATFKLCDDALEKLKVTRTDSCDDSCAAKVDEIASAQMTRDFETTLEALKAAGAETLLVDITRNEGGSDWAEAAARMVTGVPLTSERIKYVRGAHWEKKWSKLAGDLRKAAAAASMHDRAELVAFAKEAEAKAEIAARSCSSEPFWEGDRPSCEWLADGAYATGLVGSASAKEMRHKRWSSLVFSPAMFPYNDGIWSGPLVVVVDSETWSAAEEFAAVFQDNHAGVIVGAPTGGAGCGHTDGGTPTTLAHSLAVLELPDCARFRANGDNEAVGVQPDILVGFRRYDGLDRQAEFLIRKLPEAEHLAKSLIIK